jgi:hypothetical protein
MVTIKRKVLLGLGNRDGGVMVVQDEQGVCYLVVESDSYYTPTVFKGLGSTDQIEITQAAFEELVKKGQVRT